VSEAEIDKLLKARCIFSIKSHPDEEQLAN